MCPLRAGRAWRTEIGRGLSSKAERGVRFEQKVDREVWPKDGLIIPTAVVQAPAGIVRGEPADAGRSSNIRSARYLDLQGSPAPARGVAADAPGQVYSHGLTAGYHVRDVRVSPVRTSCRILQFDRTVDGDELITGEALPARDEAERPKSQSHWMAAPASPAVWRIVREQEAPNGVTEHPRNDKPGMVDAPFRKRKADEDALSRTARAAPNASGSVSRNFRPECLDLYRKAGTFGFPSMVLSHRVTLCEAQGRGLFSRIEHAPQDTRIHRRWPTGAKRMDILLSVFLSSHNMNPVNESPPRSRCGPVVRPTARPGPAVLGSRRTFRRIMSGVVRGKEYRGGYLF